jgi:hypothetical protein
VGSPQSVRYNATRRPVVSWLRQKAEEIHALTLDYCVLGVELLTLSIQNAGLFRINRAN